MQLQLFAREYLESLTSFKKGQASYIQEYNLSTWWIRQSASKWDLWATIPPIRSPTKPQWINNRGRIQIQNLLVQRITSWSILICSINKVKLSPPNLILFYPFLFYLLNYDAHIKPTLLHIESQCDNFSSPRQQARFEKRTKLRWILFAVDSNTKMPHWSRNSFDKRRVSLIQSEIT